MHKDAEIAQWLVKTFPKTTRISKITTTTSTCWYSSYGYSLLMISEFMLCRQQAHINTNKFVATSSEVSVCHQ